jgi:hypothetical protein
MKTAELLGGVLGGVEGRRSFWIKLLNPSPAETVERFLPPDIPPELLYPSEKSVAVVAAAKSPELLSDDPTDRNSGCLSQVKEVLLDL